MTYSQLQQFRRWRWWLKVLCDDDDRKNLAYVNHIDQRPIIIKRNVVAELRADERKKKIKHFWEGVKIALCMVGLGAMLYALLVGILLVV